MMQGIGHINVVQPPMFKVINTLTLLNVLNNHATVNRICSNPVVTIGLQFRQLDAK